MVQPESGAGSSQMGDVSGSGNLLASRYSSLSVSSSALVMSVGK